MPSRVWILALMVGTGLSISASAQQAAGTADAVPGPEAESEPAERALRRLDKQEFDLERALESARLDVASAQRRFAVAQDRLDAEAEPDTALREEAAARRTQLSGEQRVASLLEERIERVRRQKEAWGRLGQLRRRAVLPEVLAEWTSDVAQALERLDRELALKRVRAEELQRELEFTREQREEVPTGSVEERWLILKIQALENLGREYEREVASLDATRQLLQELVGVLERETRELPVSARLRTLWHQLRSVWSYRLTSSEEEPITPGKIVSALAIFLIGYLVAGAIARLLGARVFPRMRLEEGAAHAFQSLTFYLLLLIAFITALRMVSIPLTAFAVLGGALAIGLGFGSQNLVGNFISGVILLAERPIKIGDLIEVEGIYGSVEQIGLRSTRVRTGDNIHIIVPNSAFLEGKLINWTHTDPKVRITITVGVVYGSPTREVERLLREALEQQPLVLKQPPPIVLFRDFGADSLVFETRFWIEMRTVMDRMRLESDIRFRIDDLFRDAGIVIAFPQRDVHLDTSSPLDVRILEHGHKEGDSQA